jgi:hypothetical protein
MRFFPKKNTNFSGLFLGLPEKEGRTIRSGSPFCAGPVRIIPPRGVHEKVLFGSQGFDFNHFPDTGSLVQESR